VNWIIDNVNAKYEKNLCHIEYGDFTLADDVMKRQMLVSMAGQGAAMSTVQEALGLDPHEERKKLKDDSIKDFAQQKAVEKAIEEIETNVMARAAERNRAEQDNTVPQYDQQKLVAAAQMKAQEILGVPYEERRSLLAQLSNEDYVMYALVSAQMDSMRRTLEKGE
jgi:phosphoglycolate phosphatase-like HAD superfamily hydrolase